MIVASEESRRADLKIYSGEIYTPEVCLALIKRKITRCVLFAVLTGDDVGATEISRG